MTGFIDEFEGLKTAIQQQLIPTVLGREIPDWEHELFTLPAKKGGLAICDPASTATTSYQVSHKATEVLQQSIRTGKHAELADHRSHCFEVLAKARKEKKTFHLTLQSEVLAKKGLLHRSGH